MGKGAINVIVLPSCDHNSTLPVESRALLGCRETTMSYGFPASQETQVNLELMRELT